MKISRLVLAIVATFVLCFSQVDAKQHKSDKDYGAKICRQEQLSKIFPAPDQIVLQPNRIFVYNPDKTKLVEGQFIATEHGELYVAVKNPQLLPRRGPCGLHKVYHKACGGCGVLLCPMNCTCFD